MAPGGRLIVAVPNLASLQARIGGDRWFHQDVPRHRTHFTSAGAVAIVSGAGFEVDRVRHLVIEQNPLGMWQTLLNRLTKGRDVGYRMVKRDPALRQGPVTDLVLTALAALPARGARDPARADRGRVPSRRHDRGRGARPGDRTEGVTPRVSVVVASRGPASRLRGLLDSLRAQTIPFEAIVVDNASPGREVERLCDEYPFAVALPLSRNAGFSAPVNRGARTATGDVLVLLNDDCVCEPDFLERISSRIDASRGIVMAAGVMRDVECARHDRQRRNGARPHASGLRLPERRADDRLAGGG